MNIVRSMNTSSLPLVSSYPITEAMKAFSAEGSPTRTYLPRSNHLIRVEVSPQAPRAMHDLGHSDDLLLATLGKSFSLIRFLYLPILSLGTDLLDGLLVSFESPEVRPVLLLSPRINCEKA